MRNLILFAVLMLLSTGLFAQGNALQFTPLPYRFVTANVATTVTSNLTIEAWVKWAGPVGGNQIIVVNGNTGSSGYALFLNASASYQVSVVLGSVTIYTSSFVLSVGTWTHVAAVNSGGYWTIYVNGVGNGMGASGPNPPAGFLRVGANQSNAEGFNGIIDEVRVSDVARYTSNFTPPTTPFTPDVNTKTLYHFDEGTGQTTADASTNGNDGQLGFSASPDTLDPGWVTSDAPLPIQLAELSAAVTQGTNVQLSWTTVSEVNNYGFYVERRQQNTTSFTTVSSLIAGAGTSLQVHHYAWTDMNVGPTTYVYRLKQVDLNGHSSYSNEIVVAGVTSVNDEPAPKIFQLVQNYPNPFNPTTVIKFSVEKQEHATVRVYNMLGQKIAQLFDGMAEPGHYYKFNFNGSQLGSGMYLYRIVTDSHVAVKKLLLLK